MSQIESFSDSELTEYLLNASNSVRDEYILDLIKTHFSDTTFSPETIDEFLNINYPVRLVRISLNRLSKQGLIAQYGRKSHRHRFSLHEFDSSPISLEMRRIISASERIDHQMGLSF